MMPARPQPSGEERQGTIWYPFHGWEGQEVLGDHRRLIAQISEVETGPVTVCLYFFEYKIRAIRRLYEDAGFRVISHGNRGHWWRNTDTKFLHKQMAELRQHRRVASNRLTSAIFYGSYVGCEPAVYGDPMVLAGEDLTFGGQARVRRQWPEMHGEAIDQEVAYGLARQQLGRDFMCAPNELRQIVGWSESELLGHDNVEDAGDIDNSGTEEAGESVE